MNSCAFHIGCCTPTTATRKTNDTHQKVLLFPPQSGKDQERARLTKANESPGALQQMFHCWPWRSSASSPFHRCFKNTHPSIQRRISSIAENFLDLTLAKSQPYPSSTHLTFVIRVGVTHVSPFDCVLSPQGIPQDFAHAYIDFPPCCARLNVTDCHI